LKRRHPFRNKEICFILFYRLLVPALGEPLWLLKLK
jgi:hypothetical protein